MLPLKTAQYDGDLEPLITWVKRWVALSEYPPKHFCDWALSQFEGRVSLKFWSSVITPDGQTGVWLEPYYPHVHSETMKWDDVTTMITYLQPADEGGKFGLGGLKENDEYTFVKPTPGLALFCDSHTWHGVTPVLSGERLAILTTAHPR